MLIVRMPLPTDAFCVENCARLPPNVNVCRCHAAGSSALKSSCHESANVPGLVTPASLPDAPPRARAHAPGGRRHATGDARGCEREQDWCGDAKANCESAAAAGDAIASSAANATRNKGTVTDVSSRLIPLDMGSASARFAALSRRARGHGATKDQEPRCSVYVDRVAIRGYLPAENMASIFVWNTLAIANAKGRLGS